MKKVKISIILAAVVLLSLLIGCCAKRNTMTTDPVDNTTETTETTETTKSTEIPENLENIKSVQDTSGILDENRYSEIEKSFSISEYRNDVSGRLDREHYWSKHEVKFLENFGLRTTEYPTGILEDLENEGKMLHYPEIFRYQGTWVLLYLNYSGEPHVRWLDDEPECNCKEYLQNEVSERGFHVDNLKQVACEHGATKNCYTYVSPYMAIGYCSETGEFAHWSFGQKVETVQLQPGTVYVGYNSERGDIFRDGHRIIGVKGVRFNDGGDPEVKVLAIDAKCVLLAEYEYSAELPFGAIMYLNEDNLVRCITPYGECQRPVEHLNGSNEGGQFEMQRECSTDYDRRYMSGELR